MYVYLFLVQLFINLFISVHQSHNITNHNITKIETDIRYLVHTEEFLVHWKKLE